MERQITQKTELYRCLKQIQISSVSECDKKELLKIFKNTDNHLIRNHIALIFSDLHYDQAVPYILKKIFQNDLLDFNGSLVYSLQNLNCQKHFVAIAKIICEMGYEARLMAFDILIKHADTISGASKSKSIKLLKENLKNTSKLKRTSENRSKIQFIKESLQVLTIDKVNKSAKEI